MKKLLFSSMFALALMLGAIGCVSAYDWTPNETFIIPSWGKMSAPSENSIAKTKDDSYGFIEALRDTSSFSKYGDYVYDGSSTRFSDDYYKIHVNNYTKVYYKYNESRSTFRMRACGENFEPSAGTAIVARFCQ